MKATRTRLPSGIQHRVRSWHHSKYYFQPSPSLRESFLQFRQPPPWISLGKSFFSCEPPLNLLNSAVLAYSSLRPKAMLGTATFSSRRAPYCHHTSDHQKARKGVAVLAQRILHHQRPHCPILSKQVAFTKVDLPDGPRFPPPNQLSLTELIYHLAEPCQLKILNPFM